MNPKTLKLANIWANRRYEQNGEIFYAFSERALDVFIEQIEIDTAQQCAIIADTAEPYQSADLIKRNFGVSDA